MIAENFELALQLMKWKGADAITSTQPVGRLSNTRASEGDW